MIRGFIEDVVRKSNEEFGWCGIEVRPYKEDGTIFRSVTRQTLFEGEGNLPVEARYFEVGIDGYSTLERHDHQHLVMVIRGSGKVLVGDEVHEIGLHDVVHVPPMTYHQFQATNGEPLGFLCLVAVDRDRPQRPSEGELQRLLQNPSVAEFARF